MFRLAAFFFLFSFGIAPNMMFFVLETKENGAVDAGLMVSKKIFSHNNRVKPWLYEQSVNVRISDPRKVTNLTELEKTYQEEGWNISQNRSAKSLETFPGRLEVSHLSHGIEVKVLNDGKLCLYANLTLSISVSYEVAGNKSKTVLFQLPESTLSNASKCDATNSILKLDFREGHSWSMIFTTNDKMYKAENINFTYNLNDSAVFPDSVANETVTVTAEPDIKNVGVDTCYSCKSEDVFQASAQVNMTLSNVLIQAFVVNGNRSENLTTCAADQPVTPTPTPHVTNSTTAAPTTNVTTTALPPTTPTTPLPTLPTPTVGNYSIKSDVNSTACLLANFGLRIGFEQKKEYQEVNFDPPAEASGTCGVDHSELVLETKDISVSLTFTNDTKKFRLHAVNVTINTSSGLFVQSSTNLSLWEATVGSSYMCNKEQNFNVTGLLSLYTFSLHVQPFGVNGGLYSTAHECSMDDPSILIPIIVGAALAGLILIVVIAYVIGRRKTHVGYQTL